MNKRTVLACECGATHTAELKEVQSSDNPALTTHIVSVADFRAQRVWIGKHRPHGGIRQTVQEARMQSPILCVIKADDTAHVTDGDGRRYIATGVEVGVSDWVVVVDDDSGMWVHVERFGERAGEIDRYPLAPTEGGPTA